MSTYRRHPVQTGPLVIGLVFLGIVAVWAAFEADLVSRDDAAWIIPLVLVAAGGLGIVLAALRPARTRRQEPVPEYAGYTPYTGPGGTDAPDTYLFEAAGPAVDETFAYQAGSSPPTAETTTATGTETGTETGTDSGTDTTPKENDR
jgi:hypothetical protein